MARVAPAALHSLEESGDLPGLGLGIRIGSSRRFSLFRWWLPDSDLSRARTRRAQPIDMLIQIFGEADPHRIEDEVDSLSPSELGRRHEVGIPRHHDDLVRLLFIRDRRDV